VLRRPGWETAIQRGDRGAPHLIFDWSPDGTVDALDAVVTALAAEVSGPVASALCPHAAGPPSCWCRPPLPGLPLAFARAQGVDPSRSIFIGTGPAHRTLATAIGAHFVLA
jgi:histidinol phosphatase-like enzyme